MNAPETMFLPDVQSSADRRNIAIQRVGVKSISHPVMVASPRGPQPSVATVDMYVALPADQKGTHMSRFLALLAETAEPLSAHVLRDMMARMLVRLEATEGYIELRFPYFVRKTAPVSGVESLMDYQVRLVAEAKGGRTVVTQEVVVPVMSLCPCSKKISNYGAHNQRSHVTIAAELDADMTLDEQIRIAEQSASCELWALLKRGDEKYVTERAYDNPKFVEDLVRDVAVALNHETRVLAYRVEAENFESIHNHSAYALIELDKRLAA
ncbi:MAG: GTP cyclohydrolase FolE2 [Burkholderiaceae bacterium]